MRFFEFSNANELVLIFKNIIGRAGSQKAPAKFNWAAINNMLKSAGKEEIDYEEREECSEYSEHCHICGDLGYPLPDGSGLFVCSECMKQVM